MKYVSIVDFELEESEQCSKETAETCTSNVGSKVYLGCIEVGVFSIEPPAYKSPRNYAFSCMDKEEHRPDQVKDTDNQYRNN